MRDDIGRALELHDSASLRKIADAEADVERKQLLAFLAALVERAAARGLKAA